MFDPVINALLSNLEKRVEVYRELDQQFSFLVNLNCMDDEAISNACKAVVAIYSSDLNEEQLVNECQFAKNYFTSVNMNHESMYKTMHNDNLCTTFPNIDILLRMYLCMFVTNVTDERSFSKLKLIKNYLRNTMGEDRLNYLSLLSIESEILNELQFEDIIDKFVSEKTRKVTI